MLLTVLTATLPFVSDIIALDAVKSELAILVAAPVIFACLVATAEVTKEVVASCVLLVLAAAVGAVGVGATI